MNKEIANKKDTLKKNLLKALENTYGIVTDACKQANISRSTYYKYYKQDKQFKADVDDINNTAIDFVESQLFKLIGEGNITGIIFFLKTRGKARGYSEKFEVEQTVKETGYVVQTEPLSIDDWEKMGEISQQWINTAHEQLLK